jgi:hypothetical protein
MTWVEVLGLIAAILGVVAFGELSKLEQKTGQMRWFVLKLLCWVPIGIGYAIYYRG